MRIKNEVLNLKETDVYSLILFALYKLREIPEYSSISELAYVLDKENLLNLCEFFGGTTIKIPTVSELEDMMQALLLYQYVNIDGIEYDRAIELLGHQSGELRAVRRNYNNMCEVLEKYNFKSRSY